MEESDVRLRSVVGTGTGTGTGKKEVVDKETSSGDCSGYCWNKLLYYLVKRRENVKFVHVDLLEWKDMPRHLQFNPYILTGYRPLLTIWGSIKSLFYWHNETVNILTHGKSKHTV